MIIFVVACLLASAVAPLISQTPIRVPKTPGAFDSMLVDAPLRRLLVAHTGSHAFAVFDLASGALVTQLDLGGAPHGIAVDLRRDAYLIGTSGQPQVVIVDRRSLHIVKTIRTPGPVDALTLDTRRDVLYADADNGATIWSIGPNNTIVATLGTPQDSDKGSYDEVRDRIYQNFTTIDSLDVIDPARNQIVASWSTLPARHPHGLAVDDARDRVYVAGTNGTLVALDLRTGTRAGIAKIADNVDQITYDAARGRIYCASGDGFVSVVRATDAGVSHLSDVPVPAGAHTLALDPATGAVWISYGTARDDYLMELRLP